MKHETLKQKKHQKTGKFFLEVPYLYLVNPDRLPASKLQYFPIGQVLQDFCDKMQKEEKVDFRILGLCIQSAARLYNKKIVNVIRREKMRIKRHDKQKKKEEQTYDRPLKHYMTQSEKVSNKFYNDLVVSLRVEEKKRQSKRKKSIQSVFPEEMVPETDHHITGKKKKRIMIKETVAYNGVQIDFERIGFNEIINNVFLSIKQLSKAKTSNGEVNFVEILHQRVEESFDVDRWRLEHVRIFISILYLIKEEFIVAWKDLTTGEITVLLTDKGNKKDQIIEPIEPEIQPESV